MNVIDFSKQRRDVTCWCDAEAVVLWGGREHRLLMNHQALPIKNACVLWVKVELLLNEATGL
ncbi:hypothetical protein Pan161_16400 [Gimesia algae]|uniref:Uncharacterized protein n=2 Tax=Gimesia algae TaxID=2527971 RepID=A0A517VAH5_9PLAN|nr:hypothetical protein Pan161_16400 [Gimesia algae]